MCNCAFFFSSCIVAVCAKPSAVEYSPDVSSEEKTTARALATVIVWRRDCWRRLELTSAGITPTMVMPAKVVLDVVDGFLGG